MTRLVHLAPYALPQAGSFVPFMRCVLAEGKRRGWDVEAVLPGGAEHQPWIGEFNNAGIPVEYADGSRRQLTSWVRSRFGDDNEPTILHSHFTVYDVPAALASRGRPNLVVYWHIHTVLSNRPRALLANALKFSLIGRYVDRILAPSADVADELRRRFAKRGKVSVFPNAVDPRAFPVASSEQRAAFRKELGVPDEADVLLHFGRDWYLKDGDIFLEALRVLVEQGREVIGLVNQGGEDAERAAKRRGLEDHVRLVGLTPQPQKLYGAADLLVASSRGEAMPFTVIEALCSGIPVVASELPGHSYLGDRLDACTIVPRDANRIASAIAAFLDMDPNEEARQGATARDWISERLDVRAAATRLLDDYEQTMRGASTDPGTSG
jgi:glycosyltransferase involved in cell wall biosynthesis